MKTNYSYSFYIHPDLKHLGFCVADFAAPFAPLGGLLTGEFNIPSNALWFLAQLEEAGKSGNVDIWSNTYHVEGSLDGVQIGEDREMVSNAEACEIPFTDLLHFARKWWAFVEKNSLSK